eukprot:EG_transcript_50054
MSGNVTSNFLRGNGVGDTGAQALVEALVVNSNLKRLEQRGTRGNSIGRPGGGPGRPLRAEARPPRPRTGWPIGGPHGKREGGFIGNDVGDTGAPALVEVLVVNPSLKRLELRGCNVRPRGNRSPSIG